MRSYTAVIERDADTGCLFTQNAVWLSPNAVERRGKEEGKRLM